MLRIVETFMLFFVVVLASSQDVTSRCLRAKLVFDSKGVNLFEIPEDSVPGIVIIIVFITRCTLVQSTVLR